MRLALALALTAACSMTHGTAPPPGGGSGSGTGSAVALDCSDVDDNIDLPGQIAANAGATRGQFPLVLAHGFAGFDKIGPLGYFGEAPDALRAAGFAVYVTAVPPMASTEDVRAPTLAHEVGCIAQESGATRVNLVGHSQGGLDVRWVAASPATTALVASVTTISSPHRGVVLADMADGAIPGFTDPLFDAVASLYGLAAGAPGGKESIRAALDQMSTSAMQSFNARYPDVAGIEYFSWAGRSARAFSTNTEDTACSGAPNPDATDVIGLELALPFEATGGEVVANDGLVTVESARWGTFLGCMPADHMDEIGMFFLRGADPVSGFDHAKFFTKVGTELEARGL